MGNVPKRMQLTLSRRIRINLPSRKLEKMSSRNLEKMSCSEGFVDLVIKIDLKVTLLKGLRQELIGIDEQRGAVQPLIEMLQSPDVQLREMSAFALGRLAQVSAYFFLSLITKKLQLVDTIDL
ncbi:hypothetical protein CsSME_00007520 [Camellia sinensis var. sinensis]